jgi:hypothetical protein
MLLSFSAVAFQETRATGLQGGPDDLWKLFCSFSNDANPPDEHVPFRESRRAFCEQRPGYKEGLLKGSLLAVAPYVEDEVCGVPFHHQRPVSGGGRWHYCQSFLTVPTPVLPRKRGIDRQKLAATHVVQRLTEPQLKIA